MGVGGGVDSVFFLEGQRSSLLFEMCREVSFLGMGCLFPLKVKSVVDDL